MPDYKIILPQRNFHVIASVNKRVLAFIIDFLIYFFLIAAPFLSIYYALAGIPAESVSIETLLDDYSLFRITMIGDFSTYLIFLFYLASSEFLLGATIGKKMLNLSVLSKKSVKLSLLQLIIRNLTKSVLITFLPIDSILMFFDAEHRRLLDYVSSTIVVENRKRIKTFPVVSEI